MRNGLPFIDVLDAKLSSATLEACTPVEGEGAEGVNPIILFIDPRFCFAPGQPARRAETCVDRRVEPLIRADRAPAHSGRTLSPRQQIALDRLVALGADMDVGFTSADLRREFRILARRYHPDCHAQRTSADKARLTRLFVDLHRAYRILLIVTGL